MLTSQIYLVFSFIYEHYLSFFFVLSSFIMFWCLQSMSVLFPRTNEYSNLASWVKIQMKTIKQVITFLEMSALIENDGILAFWKILSNIQLLHCRLRSPNLDTQLSKTSIIFLSCFCFYKFIVVCLLVFQFLWKYWKKYDTSPILIIFILEYYSSFQRKASFLGNIVFLICKAVCWLHLFPIYTSQGWVAVWSKCIICLYHVCKLYRINVPNKCI